MNRLLLAQDSADTDSQTLLEVCGADPEVFCRWVFETTGSDWAATLAGQVLPTALRVLIILVAAVVLSRIVKRVIRKLVLKTASESRDAIGLLRRHGITPPVDEDAEMASVRSERAERRAATLAAVLASVAVVALWTIAIIMSLSSFGVNVGPLIAGAGIVGVALGFGAQSLVKDFLTGIFMLLEDQYGVGDVIDAGEASGTVEAVSLRVTRLRDVEGTVWHIPNGIIARVGNKSQLWSRSLLDIGVAYDTDLDRASEVISDVAQGMASDPEWGLAILEEPELWGIEQFGPNEVVLRLVMKTRPAEQWKVNREFRARLKRAFDTEGIEIPFPQRTIWVKSESGAAGVPASALGQPDEASGQPDG